jgi:hypothetical protein
MTTSSSVKYNPKGSKKATKQPSTISSSLKSIMKYGGNASAVRDGSTKKSYGGKIINSTVRERRTMEWATQEDNNKIIEDGRKETSSDIDMEMQEVGKDQEMEKGEQENASVTSEHDVSGSKWDSVLCNDSTIPSKETVNVWEQEIGRLEKELRRATTSEYKKLIEKKINEAQVMLKNSLLKMTVGADTGNYVKNKDQENSQEATKMAIDLTRDEQEFEDSKDNTAKTLTMKENNKFEMVKGKDQKHDNHQTVYDARRNMVTFNWAEESDDETVVQQNQTTRSEANWETVKGKKSSKNTTTSEETTTNIENPYIKKVKNRIGKTKQPSIR